MRLCQAPARVIVLASRLRPRRAATLRPAGVLIMRDGARSWARRPQTPTDTLIGRSAASGAAGRTFERIVPRDALGSLPIVRHQREVPLIEGAVERPAGLNGFSDLAGRLAVGDWRFASSIG